MLHPDGVLQPPAEIVLGASVPSPLHNPPNTRQHNMLPPDRTNYTAFTLTQHRSIRKNKLGLPLSQTVESASSLPAMALLLWWLKGSGGWGYPKFD